MGEADPLPLEVRYRVLERGWAAFIAPAYPEDMKRFLEAIEEARRIVRRLIPWADVEIRIRFMGTESGPEWWRLGEIAVATMDWERHADPEEFRAAVESRLRRAGAVFRGVVEYCG